MLLLRDKALEAYEDASRHAFDPERRQMIDEQIKRVSSKLLDQLTELRNPAMECFGCLFGPLLLVERSAPGTEI
jgi:hypothetical protein